MRKMMKWKEQIANMMIIVLNSEMSEFALNIKGLGLSYGTLSS
jgi:hypothetical protein